MNNSLKTELKRKIKMIPDAIRIKHHSPKSSTKLVLVELEEDINVNGSIIPEGFVSNGGTIPWFARLFINPLGEGLACFIAHDYKVGEGCMRVDGTLVDVIQTVSRLQADQELRRDLLDCGMNKNRVRIAYCITRLYVKVKGLK